MIFCFKFEMNEIVNKLLLVGYTFMPQMHLKQQGFTYSACGPLWTNHKERIQKLKETKKLEIYLQK